MTAHKLELLDTLSNSMEFITEEEFIESFAHDFKPETLSNMYEAYWELDGHDRTHYNTADWLNFIQIFEKMEGAN